jgi:cardiolipin synthase
MQLFEVLLEWITIYWVTITVILHISFSLVTSLHVLLFKENESTSLAWIGLVVLSPILGGLFYWLFGVNRIKRLAQKEHPPTLKQEFEQDLLAQEQAVKFHQLPQSWHRAIVAGYSIHPVSHVANNMVEPLINGDIAYPQMIQSIQSAKRYIVLSSYIFDYDSLGQQFVTALAQAHQRGVIVNVLLDGIGIRYSWHKSDRALKRLGVKTARFLPAISLTSIRFINLRNHRKTLCIDGEVAYIGGMNISKNNVVNSSVHPIDDIHFKVIGSVIDQISQVFIEDWFFATGKLIQFPRYNQHTPAKTDLNGVVARVIQDGPDEHHNKVRWTLINALVCAQSNVKIMTPYFIPDQTLMTSLHAAALRGVSIEIIVPQHSNIPFIDWVMEANFSRIIQHGIKIYKNKRPFDHSKIVIIDDIWSFIGSSNWDARSLEFNFEINLECFDASLNAKLTTLFNEKKQNAVAVVGSDVNDLPTYKKIRNNLFRLFSPYL